MPRLFRRLLFPLCALAGLTSQAFSAPVVSLVIPPTNSTVHVLNSIEVEFTEDVAGVDAADLLINGNAEIGRASCRERV